MLAAHIPQPWGPLSPGGAQLCDVSSFSLSLLESFLPTAPLGHISKWPEVSAKRIGHQPCGPCWWTAGEGGARPAACELVLACRARPQDCCSGVGALSLGPSTWLLRPHMGELRGPPGGRTEKGQTPCGPSHVARWAVGGCSPRARLSGSRGAGCPLSHVLQALGCRHGPEEAFPWVGEVRRAAACCGSTVETRPLGPRGPLLGSGPAGQGGRAQVPRAGPSLSSRVDGRPGDCHFCTPCGRGVG